MPPQKNSADMHDLFDIKINSRADSGLHLQYSFFLLIFKKYRIINIKMTMQNLSTSISSWDETQYMIGMQGPMDMTYSVWESLVVMSCKKERS